MKSDIIIERKEDYVIVKASGLRNTFTQIIEGTERLIDVSKHYDCKNILADYSEITFDLNLTEAFNIVKLYESKFTEFYNMRIAVIIDPKFIEIASLWERVSIKRGFDNKMFTEINAAIIWLTQQTPAEPVKD